MNQILKNSMFFLSKRSIGKSARTFFNRSILFIFFGLFLFQCSNKSDSKNNNAETVLLQNINGSAKDTLNIVIISGACCDRSKAVYDKQARKVIDKAISETSVIAKVTLVPATKAMQEETYQKFLSKMLEMNNEGKTVTPAVIINGEVVSYGVPKLEDIKKVLIKFTENKSNKEK